MCEGKKAPSISSSSSFYLTQLFLQLRLGKRNSPMYCIKSFTTFFHSFPSLLLFLILILLVYFLCNAMPLGLSCGAQSGSWSLKWGIYPRSQIPDSIKSTVCISYHNLRNDVTLYYHTYLLIYSTIYPQYNTTRKFANILQ